MTQQRPDLTGTSIGEYQVIRRLGIGGMGVVYEGLQPVIGKRVAIKTLLPALSANKEQLGRFLREAQAVNAIRHRGIVDVFSFGTLNDGTQYFVMEYLDGRGFDEVVKEFAPVPAPLVAVWLEEIFDALGAAHEAGVIHRDVKPSNLFLVEQGRRTYVKVLDFGIAKTGAFSAEGNAQSHASVVVGTPQYIAPEQAQAQPVSAATDLYAVACVAFEMLTGRLPFELDSAIQTMYAHVSAPIPHVKSFARDVPPGLDELLFALMAKKPDQRPTALRAVEWLASMNLPRPPPLAPPKARVIPALLKPLSDDLSPLAVTPSDLAPEPSPTVLSRRPAQTPQPPESLSSEPTALNPGRDGPTYVGPPPLPEETRIEPNPLLAAAAPVSSESMRRTLDDPMVTPSVTPAVPQPVRIPVWAFSAVAALVAVLIIAALPVWRTHDDPKPPVVAVEAPPTPPVEAPPPPVAVKDEVVAEPPPAVPVAAPVLKKRPPPGVTSQQLGARLESVRAALDAREKQRGRADSIGRNYLKVAQDRVDQAHSADERLEAMRFLDQVAKQLALP